MSSETQNKAGEVIGDALVWMVDHVDKVLWFMLVLFGVLVLWRLSLRFGPYAVCWRCEGSGHIGGWFGGRRKCPRCDGGLRRRIGARER